MTERESILAALSAFAEGRPGIEPGNYGDWRAYRRESAQVTRDLHDFRRLLGALSWRQSIGAEALKEAFRAYSGRLTCHTQETADGWSCALDYCTGQYYPTEFRRAACAVLATALWDAARGDLALGIERPGEVIRNQFRREFGRRLQRAYLD